ncbi:MAG: autotransporter-associated beta strand repeat-containing protein, partial [Gemmataceae bacterium]
MERFSWLRWVRSLRQPQTRTIVRSRDLRLERLEPRENPATFIWTGAGLDNFWSTSANWAGNVAPTGAPTDQLVFQSGASRLSNVNDLTNAVFASITISGNGYNLSGNAITLGDETFGTSGAITLGAGVTSATIGLNIQYGASANSTMPIAIGTGSTLTFNGQLSGTADKGLAKSGLGTLILRNANPDWDGVININQGILQVENDEALGSVVGGTSVATTAQLRLAGNLTIAEPLTLNGPGQSNDGALLAFSGNSQLTGSILLDSNVTLGANSNASMTIRGVISDAGAGYNLVKEGTGQVTLSGANTFRGQVTINNGTLALAHAQALGFTDGTEASGVVVNSTSLRSGTLLLDPGQGQRMIFANENLTLNGRGFDNQGALLAISGQVIWTGTVNLGGTSTSDVDITVEDDNTDYGPSATEALRSNFLLIGSGAPYGVDGDGLIQTPNGPRNWSKRGEGVMVLTNQNTYAGRTTVAEGILEVRDSNALGEGGSADNEIQILTISGDNGSFTLSFGIDDPTTTSPILVGPTLIAPTVIRDALASLGAIADINNIQVTRAVPFQNVFRIQFRNALGGTDLSPIVVSSVTGNVQATVDTEQDGNRNGTVVLDGATLAMRVDSNLHPALIDSKTGTTNRLDLQESITLSGNGVAGQGALRSIAGINRVSERIGLSGPAAIGVDADPNQVNNRDYLTQEYSLTIPGNLNGTSKLTKTGEGHLILPTANPFFRGDIDINSGWITVSDNESLGKLPPRVSQNQRPNVNIVQGAALHINPLTPGQSLTIQQNFSIAGQGFEHAFESISNKGAITSLNGVNYLTGNIRLSGEAGVGSVLIRPEDFPAGQLYLTGTLTQAPPTGGGSLASTGGRDEFSRTFRIGPNGSFSIDVDVYSRPDSVRIYYGTRESGDFVLVYDSDPNYVGRDPGPPVEATNQFRARIDIDFTPDSAIVDVVSLKGKGGKFGGGGGGQFGQNWQYQDLGPQTLDYGRTVVTDTIELVINEGGSSQPFTLWEASVSFSGNDALGGLAKLGDQLVVIQGNGSYQGDVLVQEGVLLVQNDTALGLAPDGGQKRVVVEEGATLALGTTLPQLNGGRQSGLQTQNFKLELNGVGNNTLLRPINTN